MFALACFFIGFAAGIGFAYAGIIPTNKPEVKSVDDIYTFDINEVRHFVPRRYNRDAGFLDLNYCKGCGIIGYWDDLHKYKCCPNCGHSVIVDGQLIGRWDSSIRRWIIKK